MTLKQKRGVRFLAVFLAACLMAAALPLHALADLVNRYEIYTVGESGGFLRIDRFSSTLDNAVNVTGDLVIPSEVGTARVEYIADDVFAKKENLGMTSVTVPSSVKKIGDRAFHSLTNLTFVHLNEGLESLGRYAFTNCYALREINLPSTLQAVEEGTFVSCLELPSITIPEGVTYIGPHAFNNCMKLASITLPDSCTSIGNYAFYQCPKLTSVRLPRNLEDISTSLFDSCTSLSDVTIYGKVNSVGRHAFGGCTSLQKVILPSGVKVIDQWAFDGCSALSTLSVPDSVVTISADAFYGCNNLTFYVNPGSTAQVFASTNHYNFVKGTLDGTSAPDPGPGQTTYPDTPFDDVKGHWAEESIKWAYSEEYFKGVSATSFKPEGLVNRGMLVTVLYRMEGEPEVGSADFSDVPSSAYYAKAVAWAKSVGVVDGVGNGKFAPTKNITRQELATMLYRYAKYKGKDLSVAVDLSGYKDVSQIGAFAGTAMTWAVAKGIVTGVTSSTLVPTGNATRAQAVVMLKRFCNMK